MVKSDPKISFFYQRYVKTKSLIGTHGSQLRICVKHFWYNVGKLVKNNLISKAKPDIGKSGILDQLKRDIISIVKASSNIKKVI